MGQITSLLILAIVVLVLIAIFVPAGLGIIGSAISIIFWLIIVVIIIAIILYLARVVSTAV
jgi:hypothetical protein